MRRLVPRLNVLLALVLALAWASPGGAGSTGTTNLYTPNGNQAQVSHGDYVSAATGFLGGGLDTSYHYWIEVPPGLARLVVEVFDADVGRGLLENFFLSPRDRPRTTFDGANAAVRYTVFDPTGATRATVTDSATVGTDNAWNVILDTTTNVLAGHWELRVDQSTAVSTAGNRDCDQRLRHPRPRRRPERGRHGAQRLLRRDHRHRSQPAPHRLRLPHLFDLPLRGLGLRHRGERLRLRRPDQPELRSAVHRLRQPDGHLHRDHRERPPFLNEVMEPQRGHGLDDRFRLDGVRDLDPDHPITSFSTFRSPEANFGNIYVSNFNLAATATVSAGPGANPPADSMRSYLPTDGGGAPVKPYLEQLLGYCSGPTPTVGHTTIYTVTVRVVNPTP